MASSPVSLLSAFIDNLRNQWNTFSGNMSEIPRGLNGPEVAVYETIARAVEARADLGIDPPYIAVITDLGKDYDDLAAMVVLKELRRLGVVRLGGFVANLVPSQKRAQFGRGSLDLLGLDGIPMATGLQTGSGIHKELPYEFECEFMAPESTVAETGEQLLERLFTQAVDNGEKMTVLCISSLADIAQFSQKHAELVRNAVSNVVLQGGYTIDAEGKLRPDEAAANNFYDFEAAKKWHTFIQESHIPSTVYTKVAAFATPLTSELFATLAETKHLLGEHLRRVQVYQDRTFYERSCLTNPQDRFRPFMDQEWFLKHKSSWYDEVHPKDADLPVGDEIIPYLTKVVVYDALAAVGAAGKDVLNALNVLKPIPKSTTAPSIHQIVGSPDSTGVNEQEMATVISALTKGSLMASRQGLR